MAAKKINIKTGDTYSDWTVIKDLGSNSNGDRRFLCRCVCGIEKSVWIHNLRRGESTKCSSCASKLRNIKHGLSYHPLYDVYANMRKRCLDKTNQAYHNYGGRGITICDRWSNSIESFIEDMGERPTPTHSLDRVDNNKGYSPENCKWSTPIEQNNNQRMKKNNTSGVVGVSYHSRFKKWCASIHLGGKRKHLGYFLIKEAAIAARESAEREKLLGLL